MKLISKMMLPIALVVGLAGCGGGGGGGGGAPAATGPVTSTLSFPIATGVRALTANGLSKNFTVTGSCTGTGTKTVAPATTGAIFEGVTGFSSVSTITATLAAGCNSISQSSTSYVDTNYTPLGFNSIGVNYGVYLTPPAYPTSVSVGATGIIGTENLYTNSTKSVGNGTVTSSYVVTADTASTAIINLIAKIYNASALLTATEQDFYKVDASGTVTPLSVDILYSTGAHIVFTYN